MTTAAGALVAFVDDEESLRTTVAMALQRDGFRVETFADGAEALARFERALPDLAILDVIMPRLDGLELCRRLRARSEHLPILILSSKDEELDRVTSTTKARAFRRSISSGSSTASSPFARRATRGAITTGWGWPSRRRSSRRTAGRSRRRT